MNLNEKIRKETSDIMGYCLWHKIEGEPLEYEGTDLTKEDYWCIWFADGYNTKTAYKFYDNNEDCDDEPSEEQLENWLRVYKLIENEKKYHN